MEPAETSAFANRTMPACSIIPVLAYADLPNAINWLCKCFGFTERWRVGHHRAQLKYGNGTIAVTEQSEIIDAVVSVAVMVQVNDVQQHYEHALQQGVNIISEPTDLPYGERQYTATDIGGYTWTFTQSIADLAPEDWGGVSGCL